MSWAERQYWAHVAVRHSVQQHINCIRIEFQKSSISCFVKHKNNKNVDEINISFMVCHKCYIANIYNDLNLKQTKDLFLPANIQIIA